MPSSCVETFADPVPYQSAIRASNLEVFPTAKGKFHAELTKINLNRLWMQRGHESLPRVFVGTVGVDRQVIGFLARPDQPAMQHRGMNVPVGDIVVSNHELVHRRTEAQCDWGSMSLKHDDLDAACLAIAGRDFSGTSHKPVVRPSEHLTSRLLKLHELAGQIAKATPALLQIPEVTRALENTLVHLMVRCLMEGEFAEMTPGGRRHDAIVARFEEFLEANAGRPIYLAEICAAIGVAERTLRICCEQHVGMGPIRYLFLRRMHLVRYALLRADSSKTTVTRIATDHGFWELGRFSVSYRSLFGETPSETLRQTPHVGLQSLKRPSSLLH